MLNSQHSFYVAPSKHLDSRNFTNKKFIEYTSFFIEQNRALNRQGGLEYVKNFHYDAIVVLKTATEEFAQNVFKDYGKLKEMTKKKNQDILFLDSVKN